MSESDTKKYGCIGEILFWIFLILIVSFIWKKYDFFSRREIPDDEGIFTTQSIEKNEIQHYEDTHVVIPALTEEDFGSNRPAYEFQTGDTSELPFITSQLEYASEHGIELMRSLNEEKSLNNWLSEFEGELYYLEDVNTWESHQFKRTRNPSEYFYYGELKDNRPDGYGVLLQRSYIEYGTIDIEERYYNLLYIGQFVDGQYDGFGLKFCTPETEIYALYDLCPFEKGSDEFTQYYSMWYNYVEYFGQFSQGEETGQGNYFSAFTLNSSESSSNIDDLRYIHIQTGSFKYGLLDGYGCDYWNGLLQYEGELKEDLKHGYGRQYYYFTDILEYEGEFKDDMRHGYGTSYDEYGKVEYSGEWVYDDYK